MKNYVGINKKMIRFIVILMILVSKNLFACTIFSVNQDESSVLVGSNCNAAKSYEYYHIEPGNDLKYGAIYFGASSCSQSGINEHGLFFAYASLSKWTEEKYQPYGLVCTEDIRKKILQECTNIEEAIELIKKYQSNIFIDHHMLIADRTGKSVIIEWDGNKLNIIPKKDRYQIATNFILSHIEDVNLVSCKRYIDTNKILNSQNVSIETCRDVLKATHQKFIVFSLVADLKKGLIYLFSNPNYENVAKLDVIEELNKKESPVSLKLSSLFESTKII